MNCPECGHDLTGDDEAFTSGGGFAVEHTIVDGVFQTEYCCPNCRTTLDIDEGAIR